MPVISLDRNVKAQGADTLGHRMFTSKKEDLELVLSYILPHLPGERRHFDHEQLLSILEGWFLRRVRGDESDVCMVFYADEKHIKALSLILPLTAVGTQLIARFDPLSLPEKEIPDVLSIVDMDALFILVALPSRRGVADTGFFDRSLLNRHIAQILDGLPLGSQTRLDLVTWALTRAEERSLSRKCYRYRRLYSYGRIAFRFDGDGLNCDDHN